MAKFNKKKLAEACDGWQNGVVNQLCNENLPEKPEDMAKLFETQAEKVIEENNKLLPYAFAETLRIETEALAKMFPNNKQNTETMKENIEKVPPITSYGECTHPNRDCKYRKDGKCPDAPMAIQFCRNCSDEDLQKADEFAKALPHALKQIAEEKERVNHPKHYQHPSGIECITIARHHDFNIGNALKYIWRAGLKQEQGIPPLDKQIEDLQKAVFYIQDEIQFIKSKQQEQ